MANKKKATTGFAVAGTIFLIVAVIMNYTILSYLFTMALCIGIVLLVMAPAAWFVKQIAKHDKAIGGAVFIVFFLTMGLSGIVANASLGGGAGSGTTPAPFGTPEFYDGTTKLNPNLVHVYVVGVNNNTGAAVLRYNGLASGLTAVSQILPVSGSTYSFSYIQCWVSASDTGSTATSGVFNDLIIRTYANFAFQLPAVDITKVQLHAYRNTAPLVNCIAGRNNTVTAITATNVLKSSQAGAIVAASNLTVNIFPSSSFNDAHSNVGYATFSDYVNGSNPSVPAANTPLRYGLYLSIKTNGTDAQGAAALRVTCGGNVLTALQNVGAANTIYFALPATNSNGLILGHAPLQVSVVWTAVGAAAAYGINAQPAVIYGADITPNVAYYTL